MLSRFHLIPEGYVRTDRQTDLLLSISRVSMLTRDKNAIHSFVLFSLLFVVAAIWGIKMYIYIVQCCGQETPVLHQSASKYFRTFPTSRPLPRQRQLGQLCWDPHALPPWTQSAKTAPTWRHRRSVLHPEENPRDSPGCS